MDTQIKNENKIFALYKMLLMFIVAVNNKLGKKLRLFLSSTLFSIVVLAWYADPYFNFSHIGYLSIFSIIFITILSLSLKSKSLVINKLEIALLILIGLSYIVSAFLYQVSARFIVGLTFILLIPIVNILLAPRENKRFFITSFSLGNVFAFIIIILISIIYAPLTDGAYSSIMLNPNGFAFALLPISFSIIYLIEKSSEKPKKIKYILLILLGINFSLMLFTRSRTGLLAYIFILSIWLIFLKFKFINNKLFFKKILITLLLFAIMFLVTYLLLTIVNQEISILKSQLLDSSVIFFSYECIEVDNTISNDDVNLSATTNVFDTETFQQTLDSILTKSSKGITSDDDISSGRFIIWNKFFSVLKLEGHAPARKIFIPERSEFTANAHNIFLQVGYDIGFVPMILLLLFFISLVIRTVKKFREDMKNQFIKTDVFFFYSTAIAFGIVAMLSSMFLPYGSALSIAFWFTMPLVKTQKSKEITSGSL